MRRLLPALVIAACVCSAPQAFAGGGLEAFRTPSGNIHCGYLTFDAPLLRCEIRSGLRPRPAKPSSCEFDWAAGYSLTPRGSARILCISDTVADPRGRVLRYGTTWRRGAFTCVSRSVGLRCSNRAGRGFFLSRQRSYRF